MMHLFSGTPGSGKSMHLARLILDSLVHVKRPVIANFDINPDTRRYAELFHYVPNGRLTPDYLYDFARRHWAGRRVSEDSILLALDEAQLLFNSRSWNEATAGASRLSWIEFFSQHRHFGFKIVLVAQNDRMIDRQIRALVELEHKHRRLSNFGLKGAILALPFAGKLFASVKYYYGLNEKVGVEWFFPRRRYLRLYDSYNRFEQA